jgi:hypothetical protein
MALKTITQSDFIFNDDGGNTHTGSIKTYKDDSQAFESIIYFSKQRGILIYKDENGKEFEIQLKPL